MIEAVTERDTAISYYDDAAPRLAPLYDSVAFEDVHGSVLRHLPRLPADVLDVGAGSGRDARALAAMGHRVVAVEPAAAFRVPASRSQDRVEWLDDRLPDLAATQKLGRRFDLALCSAVLMTLAPQVVTVSLATLAGLLRSGGLLVASVRDPAPDEPEGTFHPLDDEALVAAARRAGFGLIDRTTPKTHWVGRPGAGARSCSSRIMARANSPRDGAPGRDPPSLHRRGLPRALHFA